MLATPDGEGGCGQCGATCVASRTPCQRPAGCGGRQRSEPTGGGAEGMATNFSGASWPGAGAPVPRGHSRCQRQQPGQTSDGRPCPLGTGVTNPGPKVRDPRRQATSAGENEQQIPESKLRSK